MQANQIKGMVPNIFTMGNLVCGFMAILASFEGQVIDACWLIILGGFLDVLDGKIARFSGTSSPFGRELDSLSDFLSFGVAPAVVVYIVKLQYMGKWGWLIGIVYIMCAGYRLARYNLMAESDEKKDFLGLPTPMSAAGLVSYIIFSFYIWDKLEYSEYLVVMIVAFSFLMISQFEYNSAPDNFNNKRNRIKILAVIVCVILLVINYRLFLFPIAAIYIILGIVTEIYRFFFHPDGFFRLRQEKEDENMEQINE